MDFVRRHPDAIAAVALILLPFALLGRALLPGYVLAPADTLLVHDPWKALAPGHAPKNPLMTDVVSLFHPWAIYAGREISEGRFPLWNPHVFTGAPFFANPQTALLFPLTALAYVLPGATAVTLSSILKLSAAGTAMYWCLRVLRVGPLSAAVAALVFMLNGQLLVWLQWSLSNTMAMLPVLVGVGERLRQGGGIRWAALLAVTVALLIFGGYPQGAIVGVLLATAWAASRLRRAVAPARFALSYGLGLALGILLAAVQLLPSVEYLRASSLVAYRDEWIPSLHLAPRSAITLLLPFYYGSPMGRDFWGDFNFNEITLGVGVVPWLVLPLAVLAGWRRPGTKFFVAVAVVSGATLYGQLGTPALFELPGLSSVSHLHVTPMVLVFALAVLCGLGLDAAAGGHTRGTRLAVRLSVLPLLAAPLLLMFRDYPMLVRHKLNVQVVWQYFVLVLLVTAAAVLLLRWLRGGEHAWRWALALGGVQLLSVAPLALTYNPVIDARWFYPSTPAIEHLRRETARDHGRVAMGFNVAMLYGLSDAAGFDALTPRRVERLVGPIGYPGRLGLSGSLGIFGNEGLSPTTVFQSPSFDLLGVRYVVTPPPTRDMPPQFSPSYAGPDARIYRNELALPRAFLVSGARCVEDGEALRGLWGRNVDVRAEVLLADCDRAPGAGPRGALARTEIRAATPQRITIAAATDAPAYLVLTDTWFPGWRVWVDGAEQRLWRADYAFRAVWLPAGTHEVEFRYVPSSVRVGLGVSALAAAAIVLLAVGSGAIRRWRRGPRTAGFVIGSVLLAASTGVVHARLPAPPFELAVSPSEMRAGADATLRVTAAAPGRDEAPTEQYDLYLIRGLTLGSIYLTPGGEWSREVVPYRRAVSTSTFTPVTQTWRAPTPGWISVSLVAVKSGSDPMARADWRFRPVVRRIRVNPAPVLDDPGLEERLVVVGGLAIVALAAFVGVLADPAGRAAHTPPQ